MLSLPTGVVLLNLLACGSSPDAKEGPVVVPGTAPINAVRPSSPTRPTPSLPVGLPDIPEGSPTPGPMPLVITQPGTCDACSLLMEHDFDALKSGKACRLCGAADPTVCEGWPEPGMVPCETYDWLRNCMYARLGYDFETAQEWRVTFEQESWYVPDPRFRWSRVTPVQNQNARVLRDLVQKKRCIE